MTPEDAETWIAASQRFADRVWVCGGILSWSRAPVFLLQLSGVQDARDAARFCRCAQICVRRDGWMRNALLGEAGE